MAATVTGSPVFIDDVTADSYSSIKFEVTEASTEVMPPNSLDGTSSYRKTKIPNIHVLKPKTGNKRESRRWLQYRPRRASPDNICPW